MRKFEFYLFFILIFFFSGCGSDDQDKGPSFQSNLETVLDQVVVEPNLQLKGISASVMLPDGKINSAYAGISYEGSEINETHLFGIASVTKTFVATIIMQLKEESKLTLDDAIGDHLVLDTENIDPNITILQLLNHTSGVYNYNEHPNGMNTILSDPLRLWEPSDVFSFVEEPEFTPGEGWDYSNTNYILLGMIIESVTGNSFYDELYARIITPLGLNQTFFPPQDDLGSTVANPWTTLLGDELTNAIALPKDGLYSAAWTAGAMFSTSRDLVVFSQALFEGDLLTEESLELMMNTIDKGGSGHWQAYGLGLMFFEGPVDYWGHNGLVLGYGSLLAYLPNQDVHITFLVNREISGQYDDIMGELIAAVLNYLENS